jgi:autotransporter family porin
MDNPIRSITRLPFQTKLPIAKSSAINSAFCLTALIGAMTLSYSQTAFAAPEIIDNSSSITTSADNQAAISKVIGPNGSDSEGLIINQTGGTLTTYGDNSAGISVTTSARTGDITINVSDTIMNLQQNNSDGIYLVNVNSGASNVSLNINTTGGEINTLNAASPTGNWNYGIVAIQSNAAAGDINIRNEGTKISTGLSGNGTANTSDAIAATFGSASASGNLSVYNNGALTTLGDNSSGINATNYGSGWINVTNLSSINVSGQNSFGIIAAANSNAVNVTNHGTITTQNGYGIYGVVMDQTATSDVTIINSGNITTHNGSGIYAVSGAGNVNVSASGNISAKQQNSPTGLYGINATSISGSTTVAYQDGTIKVSNTTPSGDVGLVAAAWNLNNTATGNDANVIIGPNATIDAREGSGGIQMISSNKGDIFISAGSAVHGGASSASSGGVGISFYGLYGSTLSDHRLTNNGFIDALSDLAIASESHSGSTLTINNYGTIDGYVTFGDEDTTFSNWSANSWNIRNFADTDGDGVRDAKEIAVSDFGAGYDVFKNEATGTVRLLAVSGETNIPVAAGYIPDGALDITNAGTVHGHLLNLDRFENRGTIDLSDNGQAGDVLLITGGATAGANGGGKFVADGGFLRLDTVLNDGDLNSLSDVLVVDEIEAGSDVTRITINRVGGMGAITIGDGIKVVDVLGNADAGSFALDGVVKGGIYEYTLHEGSVTTPGNNSLFLRTSAQQLNPDIGSYLANQTAATGLFMHSLHDRLGEPQLYQNYREEDKSIPAVWLRAVAGHTKNEAGGGLLNQHSESTLLHLGGEVADWSSNGDDRFHLGLMGAWGRVETKTTSQATDSRVKGTVDGYGVGAYLTWYDNPANVEGWYSDVWTMYNWFNNETEGSAKYDSESWTTSLEVGYAMKLSALENYDWMLEPQGQVAYNYYSVDSIKDRNGMKVTDSDANGFATRLGMRTYLRPSTFRNGAQPFFEVNWLYNSANNSMMFNDARIADDTPENRFEAKVGVQGEMTKHLQVYSHIGLQWGQNSYEHAEGQVGVRYRF